jgi:hypothetical protein
MADVPPIISGLLAEDIQIHSVNLSRWSDPSYTLRVEEMEILVEMFNSLSCEASLGVWCMISPHAGIMNALLNPNKYSVSDSIMSR